jgi:hypothetical protein
MRFGGRPRFRGGFDSGRSSALDFRSFISSCGFGGMRTMAAIIFVAMSGCALSDDFSFKGFLPWRKNSNLESILR